MNQKILNQLIVDLGKSEITPKYIKSTFDIDLGKKYNNVEQYAREVAWSQEELRIAFDTSLYIKFENI